jgi:hypothetical protein
MPRAYPPNSRYAQVPTRTYVAPDGRVIEYGAPRPIPDPARHTPLARHRVESPQRLDLLAAQYYGDPEQYWRICDANLATWPPAVGQRAGETLVVPLPLEVSDRGEP